MAAGSSAKRTLGGADYLALDMNGDGGENGLGMGSVQAGSANQQAQMMEQQVCIASGNMQSIVLKPSRAG